MFKKTRCSLGLQFAMFSKHLCNRCEKQNRALQLVLHGAIQRVTCPLCNLSRNFFGLATTATCNGFLFPTLRDKLHEELHCVNYTNLRYAIVASPKKLRDKLERGNATRCNLRATYLATSLRDKLQAKLHLVMPDFYSRISLVADKIFARKECSVCCLSESLK